MIFFVILHLSGMGPLAVRRGGDAHRHPSSWHKPRSWDSRKAWMSSFAGRARMRKWGDKSCYTRPKGNNGCEG